MQKGRSKPLRAWHGARLRPRLAWELLGGSEGLAEPLAAPCEPALALWQQLTPHRADRGRF